MSTEVEISDLPREILVHIFNLIVNTEGIASLLDLSEVCSFWKEASQDSKLYHVVDDSRLSKDKLLLLMKHFSQTYHLNLTFLGPVLTATDMMDIFSYCPKVRILDICLRNIPNLDIGNLLNKLSESCAMLEKLLIQNCQIFPTDCGILQTLGRQLKCLNLTNIKFSKFEDDLEKIAISCPLLEEFQLHGITGKHFFPFDPFQMHCPYLKVFILELEDIEYSQARYYFDGTGLTLLNTIIGFPNLEHFTCKLVHARTRRCGYLNFLLKESSKLRFLDLRGNVELAEITVPCDNLETLYLSETSIDDGSLYMLLNKTKDKLKNLDLSMWHDEFELNASLMALVDETDNKLEELNLYKSSITEPVLFQVLSKCPNLKYLNIEACRKLKKKEMRCIYNTQEGINTLVEMLKDKYQSGRLTAALNKYNIKLMPK